MTGYLRKLRRFLGNPHKQPYSAARHRDMARRAYAAVQAFYVVNLFFAYQSMYTLMDAYGKDAASLTVMPLWPVWFLTPEHLPFITDALAISYVLASLWAAAQPYALPARLLVYATALGTCALKYSFGVLPQKEIMWLWAMLVFIFLPSVPRAGLLLSRGRRQHYLDIFSAAQGLILLFYFLTGFWKIAYGIVALFVDNVISVFSPYALAYIVNYETFHEHVQPLLAPWLRAHPYAGFPAFLWVLYIECGALCAWLRPSLHRPWAVMLILFHIATWLLMGIPFYLQPPLLAVLLLMSPFAPDQPRWRDTLRQMPLVRLARSIYQGNAQQP